MQKLLSFPQAAENENSLNGISTLVVKIASRCNLNCRYCYMYNLADSTWKAQPKFMSDETILRLLEKWRDHVTKHRESIPFMSLVLHGGEPLLAGPQRLDRWLTMARQELPAGDIPLSIGVQSNGLLLDDSICKVLCKHGVSVGISIDGVPGAGDILRVDHSGVPSGRRVEERIRWLQSSEWSGCFGGILSVVNIHADPIETIKYVSSFGPARMDFRLPLSNHDHPPERPEWDVDQTSYGKWLAAVFDYVVDNDVHTQVRILDAIINSKERLMAYHHMIGNTELYKACVVETDGSFELVDNLKSTVEGMTKTGMSIHDHSFDEFADFAGPWRVHPGLDGNLASRSNRCRSCFKSGLSSQNPSKKKRWIRSYYLRN